MQWQETFGRPPNKGNTDTDIPATVYEARHDGSGTSKSSDDEYAPTLQAYGKFESPTEDRKERRRKRRAIMEGGSSRVLDLIDGVLSRLKHRGSSSMDSSCAKRALREMVFACNSLAMSALGRGNMMRCKELLERAFEVANDNMWRVDDGARDALYQGNGMSGEKATLLILTLNNAACLQRRLGEPKRALKHLHRAAVVARGSGESEDLELIHLNACAVLSELGRHEEALQHARSAVFHGQERAGLGKPRRIGSGKEKMLAGSRRARLATLATLAISYHNLAVELEYTGRYDACLQWYKEALKLARDPDVGNEDLTETFERSYASASKLAIGIRGEEKKSKDTCGS